MIKFEGELLERVSRLDHEIWKHAKAAEGYHYPSECPYRSKGNRCKKCSMLFIPYDVLPEDVKELNRIRWRNMDKILSKLGFRLEKLPNLEVPNVVEDAGRTTELRQDPFDPLGEPGSERDKEDTNRGLL